MASLIIPAMRYLILLYLLLSCNMSIGQEADTWTSFWNHDTTLVGFRDKNGVVKVAPKFTGLTRAKKFDHIAAVTEEVNGKYTSYYLTKAMKIAGRDSVFIFDNTADCESEGFIRFRDPGTGSVGMLNDKGDVVLPATYNALSSVHNGMIIALTGAKKKFWDHQHAECSHFSWVGGKTVLIRTDNTLLIDNFDHEGYINLFSMLVSDKPDAAPGRVSFKGVNGRYYSFIDFEKEFTHWLRSSLLNRFNQQNLLNNTYPEIRYWKEEAGWVREPKAAFVERNFECIRSALLALGSPGTDYHFSMEGLNPFTYDTEDFKYFYDNCGEAKDWIYPVVNVVISYGTKENFYQDHIDFLRTDNGYKLISVSVKNAR